MRGPADVTVRGAGGARLRCLDYGGGGRPVLLLHGLCGDAGEWAGTAARLRRRFRVLALDQRGHGASDHTPGEYAREDYVADVVAAIEQLGLAPVVLVGQSMGGLNAYLVASRRPDLVGVLVVVEAQASANPDGARAMRDWLRSLPEQFADADGARAFMQEAGFPGETWRELLEERADGWAARFDVEGAIASTADFDERDYWDEWRALSCPVLVVGGAQSEMSQDELRQMAACVPAGRYAVVEGAGHNVQLDRPEQWHAALERFLDEHDPAVGGAGRA
jgi:pimeloyl-ACP methyl ester carboxylesterase